MKNALDIVSGCSETPIVVSEALNTSTEPYTDWYLPSQEELQEMYNIVGNGSSQGNIGEFESWDYPNYWSFSEGSSNAAWGVNFYNGSASYGNKNDSFRVRVVRAF